MGLAGIFSLLSGIFKGRLVGAPAELMVYPESDIVQEILRPRSFSSRVLEVLDTVPRWISEPFPFFLGLAVILFLGLLLIHKEKKKALANLLMATLLLLYGFLFAFLFFMGLNPFVGGWMRAYWGFTVLLGVVISLLMGLSLKALRRFFSERLVLWNISCFSLEVLLSGALFLVGFLLLVPVIDGFTSHILTRSHCFSDQPGMPHEHAQESSAYPSALSISQNDWSTDSFNYLVPSWLDPNRLDYRLYEMDATVNIWWSSLFDMPQVRGYQDSPGGVNYNGWQYWMNVVLAKDEIVDRLEVPLELAVNQAKFFIDWHAIGYLEGISHATGRGYSAPVSTYIIDEQLVGEGEEVNIWRPMQGYYVNLPGFWETLKYYKVSPEATSPIYQATNAPAVLVVGDLEAQNIMMRLFGSLNLNSQKAILVQGSPRVDDYSLEELKGFKMVALYRYAERTSGRDWEMLEKYVRNGGVLFVDTGDKRPEAEAKQLPALFPISANVREPLGKEWALKGNRVFEDWGVDVTQFTAPVFDDEPWSFSYAEPGVVDRGTRVLLKNYEKVILADATLGNGSVIWSGMNLPYHILREYNLDELRLFRKLLERAVSAEAESFLVGTDFERPSPEKVVIRGNNANAVLFKEAGYEGWGAYIKVDGAKKKLKVYHAGPMQPGYMYAFIPPEFRDKNFEVVFTFRGAWKTWVYYFINLLGILLTIDLITGKHGLSLLRRVVLPLRNKAAEWWEREEEY